MRRNISRSSAYQLLITELAQHGRITYAELERRHPDYSRSLFATAAYRARKEGIVAPSRGRGGPIVAMGACPCCGRRLATNGRRAA